LANLSETISGMTTIRSFHAQEKFIEKQFKFLDNHIKLLWSWRGIN